MKLSNDVRLFFRYLVELNDVILLPIPEIVLVRGRELELFTILMSQLSLVLIGENFLLVKSLLICIEILIELIEQPHALSDKVLSHLLP